MVVWRFSLDQRPSLSLPGCHRYGHLDHLPEPMQPADRRAELLPSRRPPCSFDGLAHITGIVHLARRWSSQFTRFRSGVFAVGIGQSPFNALSMARRAQLRACGRKLRTIRSLLEPGYGFRAKSVGFKTRQYHLLIRQGYLAFQAFCEFIFLFRRNRRGRKWRSSRGMDWTNGSWR